MTLDEAIIHAEEVADYDCYNDDQFRCAEEHRQLAEWLRELKRARVLLKAAHELLMKQNDSGYVLNLLGETVFYDDAECDGRCLMEDIECLLEDHI